MKDQLLDVTIVVASVESGSSEFPYAVTQIYRVDLESANLEEFIKTIGHLPGVAHVEKLVAG